MKRSALFLCITALLLSACGTMDMRKISVEPKISTDHLTKSSLKTGLLLDREFTSRKHSFQTGTQIYLLANVKGEMEIGKNLSQALYGIVSSKFGNLSLFNEISEKPEVDIYFVPRIKSFTFSPPFTGLSSFLATIELETDIFDRDGKLLHKIIIKQKGSKSMMNQLALMTNYEMAADALNEAINNTLSEFTEKLNQLY